MRSHISISQAAKAAKLSTRRMRALCIQKRIPGAWKAGAYWLIPNPFEITVDPRIKKTPRADP